MTRQDDRTAWRRVPWGGATGEQDWIVLGEDWSAATFALQVRYDWGDTGTPLVSLTNASAGSEGISATYDADYVDPVTGDVAGGTIIRPQIAQATLEAISAGSDPAADLGLVYDLHLTTSGLPKMQLVYGAFTLKPGATI